MIAVTTRKPGIVITMPPMGNDKAPPIIQRTTMKVDADERRNHAGNEVDRRFGGDAQILGQAGLGFL